MQISPEHQLALDAAKIEDEWLTMNDKTGQVNLSARQLLGKLSEALMIADQMTGLDAPLEADFIRQVLLQVNKAWTMTKGLVASTGGLNKKP